MHDVIFEINDPQIELTEEFLIVLRSQIEPLEELVHSMNNQMDKGDAPKPKKMVADGLEAELEGDLLEDNLLEEDLLAEPVLLP